MVENLFAVVAGIAAIFMLLACWQCWVRCCREFDRRNAEWEQKRVEFDANHNRIKANIERGGRRTDGRIL